MLDPRSYLRSKVVSDIDLNRVPAADENMSGEQETQLGHDLQTLALFPMEVIDDDFIEISTGAFAEAKRNSRRNRWKTIYDVADLEDEQPPKKLVFSCLSINLKNWRRVCYIQKRQM